MAGRFSSKAGRTALGGVLAAGSLAVLWLACVTPTGRLLAGRGAGFLCWAAASVLGLLILPDKGVALMYLCFMGLYPVVKSRLEQCASRPLEWVGKLACFNAALTLLWVAFRGLFLPALPEWLAGKVWLLYGAGNLVFLLYDWGLSRLIGMMTARLKLR